MIHWYHVMAKVSLFIALSSSIFTLIMLSVFLKLLKKHANKRVSEVEPQLSKILDFMAGGAVVFCIFGVIGIILNGMN